MRCGGACPRFPNRSLATATSLLCLLLAGGCGEDRPRAYPTKGRVIFADGTPVKLGTVELLSQNHGTTASGKIGEDGSFVLGTYTPDDGACDGPHKAIISQLMIFDGMVRHTMDHGSPVDPLYGSYNSSPLKVDIRRVAQNTLELKVEKAKKEPRQQGAGQAGKQ
ncbi:MAG: carboxypeptidase regulatory-like domain-containing protein [Planctomyces sp.]